MRYANRWVALLGLLLVLGQAADLSAQAGRTRGSVRLPEAADAPEKVPEEEGATAKQVDTEFKEETTPPGAEMVYLNVEDQDIVDVIRQISKATGKNFIIDDKIKGRVTIMSEKMMTKEEAYQAFLSALEVAGYTTVTGPGGIIKVVSTKEAVSSPIPIHVDSTPYTDSFVTRLISLENISALDMSNAIKGLISKEGNMFAYPATNTLIITDSGTNIDRLMKIIKELDQEGPQQVLEIIPINYASAKEVASTVLNIFEIEKQKTTSRTSRRSKTAQPLEELQDVSKIIADERTNSLIVLASKRAIAKVRDVIKKLDVPLTAGETGTIHVHYLKYANAMELAQTLQAVTSKSGSSAATAKKTKGATTTAVAQLEGGITIGADETTNALIITASAKDYKTVVDDLISKLDIPRRQVFLESIVMELDVQKGSSIGFSGFGGGGPSSFLGLGSVGSTPTSLFDPTSFFAAPGLLGGILSRKTVTIDVPQSGGGTTQVSIPAFGAFLSLLQDYRNANIVSTPNILTLDNQKASIEVTRTIYARKETTIANAGSTSFTPEPLEAGLTLEITPQISEGDAVRLEINQKLSNFTGDPDTLTGAAPSTKRQIQTTVMAMDGQTVVLGGLMQDADIKQQQKTPLLGDIPLLGFLFRQTKTSKQKTNLVIFITPHVIRDPSDFAAVTKDKIEQRNRFIENNFGKRQQRQIRETIAMHRADLLEYSPQLTRGASESTLSAPLMQAPVPAGPVITVPPGGGGVKATTATQPVITAQPPARGGPTPASPNLKGTGELDLSY